MTRNEALALLAGAGAAPQLVLLTYHGCNDGDTYRRAIDALDALGVNLEVEWHGDHERVTVWLGDTNEIKLHGPVGVRTHAPVETLATRRLAPTLVPDWAA